MNEQVVQFDSVTKQLYINKDSFSLISQVFALKGQPLQTPDGTPLVRIIITW